jgi:hypothetical protein
MDSIKDATANPLYRPSHRRPHPFQREAVPSAFHRPRPCHGLLATILLQWIGWQRIVETPHRPAAELLCALAQCGGAVRLRLKAHRAGHVCPLVLDGDRSQVVQRPTLAHLDLLGRFAGDDNAGMAMAGVRRVARQPVDRLAAGGQRKDVFRRG